ncbi:MAG: multifunctional CCA addition/repair protein [Gammaproteobacteria bacterium]|nr:MAG: multifunctional CCA addition/repair protein [Gammaproteobacteria bacterium]
METYLVGGAIRDRLLKLPVVEKDWIIVGSEPATLLKLGYKQVGKDFPVFLHPTTSEEYALARVERKISPGYCGFETNFDKTVSLEQDLCRRDLTINAIAEDKNGKLIDPYHGIQDLKNKILRHVSSSFIEDPLRVLRLARFYAKLYHLGFKVADETYDLMLKMTKNGELNSLVSERVWVETKKALSQPDPQEYFNLLRAVDALKILYPEINNLFGKPQPAKYHPEVDSGIHTMLALKQACKISDNTKMRFGVLCHDFGKGTTTDAILPSHYGHEKRGVKIINEFSNRLKIPTQYQKFASSVAKFHTHCHKITQLKATTILKTLNSMRAIGQSDDFKLFLSCCKSDARGRTKHEKDEYPQANIFANILEQVLKIDNKKVIAESGARTNKEINKVINKAHLKVIKEVIKT